MAKLTRFTGPLKIFASAATGLERTVFGSTTQSNDIDLNLNAAQERGWGTVGVNESPTKQDFNAQGWTLARLIAYLYQSGVPEYNSMQDYHLGDYVNVSGVLYKSIQNNNTGNTPASSPAWWSTNIVADATTSAKGIVQLATNAEVATGTDTAKVSPVSSMVHHQGVAKAWVNYNQATNTINDSYNVSSVSDTAVGRFGINFATPMANNAYIAVGNGAGPASMVAIESFSTGTANMYGTNSTSAGLSDFTATVAIFGDR